MIKIITIPREDGEQNEKRKTTATPHIQANRAEEVEKKGKKQRIALHFHGISHESMAYPITEQCNV